MGKTQNIFAIILAAGGSSRFGSPKQIAQWNHGNLLQHSIQLACSVFGKNVLVVLGADADRIRNELDSSPINVVINPDWHEGIASSIRTGINALPDTAVAVMILLCDQPVLRKKSLEQLVTHWQQKNECIVASQYANTVGVPAIFPAALFPQLKQLRGDQGAKPLLQQNKEQVIAVSIPEAAIDIDTRQDFENLKIQYHYQE